MPGNWIQERLVLPYLAMKAEPFRRGLLWVEKHGISAFSDIKAVAEREGYRVIRDEKPFREFRKKKLGACLFRHEGRIKCILVDPSKDPIYQRSSIIHEIAHDKLCHDLGKQSRRQEREANLFTFAVDFRIRNPTEDAHYQKHNRDIQLSMVYYVLCLVAITFLTRPIEVLSKMSFRRSPRT